MSITELACCKAIAVTVFKGSIETVVGQQWVLLYSLRLNLSNKQIL
jgi:hypothetical protein